MAEPKNFFEEALVDLNFMDVLLLYMYMFLYFWNYINKDFFLKSRIIWSMIYKPCEKYK